MFTIDFAHVEELQEQDIALLNDMWRRCVARIIISTTLAGSGHPGGSMSSLHALLLLYAMIRHDPKNPRADERDRVLMSMGHVSPGVYSVLAEYGYVSEERFITEFRRAGSPFAGHVEQAVPGVEWNTGNLGQGLSAGAAVALGQRLKGIRARTFVFMGDGEQQKGQVAEARRFAMKFGLGNLYCLIDRNHLQIGGSTEDVMPVRVRAEYEAAGWNVVYCPNGNDFAKCYKALRQALMGQDLDQGIPTAVVMRTIMGFGVSFMEDKAKYHGAPLKPDEAKKALEEIGVDPGLLDKWREKRDGTAVVPRHCENPKGPYPEVNTGGSRLYAPEIRTDCRSAYGNALKDLAQWNNKEGGVPRVLGVSCDLEGSVKMQGLHQVSPEAFLEVGIQEHHAAVLAGALSREGFCVFFSTFGVFAVAETYNQHRLNDLNDTHLKVVATHLGLDVGEDGPTHQCIDYVGLLRNLFGFSIFIPADPNQTDRIIRYVASTPGNAFVGMGRSKMPVVLKEDGTPFFDEAYVFRPGKGDWLRQSGDDRATIVSYGAVTPEVIGAWEILKDQGLPVAVLNMASLKPVDREALVEAGKRGPVITVEDHVPETGLGAIAASVFLDAGLAPPFKALGVRSYGASGKPLDLYRMQGLDRQSIANDVRSLCGD